jgi:hypothetical protein
MAGEKSVEAANREVRQKAVVAANTKNQMRIKAAKERTSTVTYRPRHANQSKAA